MRLFFVFIILLYLVPRTALHAQTANATEEDTLTSDYQNQDDEVTVTPVLIEPDAVQGAKAYKNEKVAVRKFDNKKWKKIIGNTSFSEKEAEKQSKTKNFNIPWNSNVLRVVSYIFIVAVIGLLIYAVIKNISVDDFKIKKTPVLAGNFTAPVENIEELNIYDLLQQAISEGNFKLAIRLYYLDLLKRLNENGVIAWKKDKTNREYLKELFLKNFYVEDVRKLTLAYEQVWYGDHVLTPEGFQRLATDFERIKQNTLNTSKSL